MNNYLEFDHPVPFKDGQHYYESALQREDGGTNKGAFGRSVRLIPESEYDLILQAGFTKTLELTKPATELQSEPLYRVAEDVTPFERSIIERVVARPFRDAAFAVAI